jgi:hypothetical protein
VRELAVACVSRLYAAGDLLPLFSRVSALQASLQQQLDARGGGAGAGGGSLGGLELLAALCLHHGRCLASSMPESLAIAAKCVFEC